MKNKKIVTIAVILAVVGTMAEPFRLVKEERRKREIDAKTQRDIASIRVAYARVQERIAAGRYNSLDAALTDLDFETIVDQLD